MGKYCGFWFGKSETQGKRHCPVCNELIPDNVSVCPYCDEPVDPVQTMAHVMTEKVISVHRCHAMVFAPWLAASVIAIIIIIYITGLLPNFIFIFTFIVCSMVYIVCLGCIYETICRMILYFTSEYIIRGDGININQAKFLNIIQFIDLKYCVSVSIESFHANLNCGTVKIVTTDGKVHKLRQIIDPCGFKDSIDNLLLN